MMQVKHVVILGLSALLLVLLVAAAAGKQQRAAILGQDISIHRPGDHQFVLRSEIEKVLPKWEAMPIREINTHLLEEKLENHPAILRAEVYCSLNQRLQIEVWQHKPLARFFGSPDRQYLLTEGKVMPVTAHYSAEAPLLTGQWPDSLHRPLAKFLELLEREAHWQGFFNGVHRDAEGDWWLYPRAGGRKVRLGQAENLERKMRKLAVFYRQAGDKKTLEEMETIDLRFENQVICKRL